MCLVRLKALLNWAMARGLVRENPVRFVKSLNVAEDQREVSRALTPAEFEKLLKVTPSEERRLYYLLGGRLGLRWSEIRRLRWGDFDLQKGRVNLRAEATKARRTESLPLPADVEAALRAMGAGRRGPVFGSSPTLKTWKRDLERAEIPYETEAGQADRKCLRKTFGTHLALKGVDLRVAMRLMRHRDPALTATLYTDPMLLDMKGAVASLAAGVEEK